MNNTFSMDGDDLGYVYICERTDTPGVTNVQEISSGSDIAVTYDQVLQSFDVLNRNQRYYDGDNIWECIMTEAIQSKLAHNGWFMELDHPTAAIAGQKLSPERVQNIEYTRRCAVIKNPRRQGNLLIGTITTTSNDLGIALAKDMIGPVKYKPMASCRAIATMRTKNGKPYVFVKKLITYDTVSYASHREADMITTPSTVTERVKAVTERVSDVIKSAASDVFMPLAEILKEVGINDPTTEMVLESFGLDETHVVGFNESKTHVCIKDDDNQVYVKMQPETVKKVHEYFASF